MNKVHVVKEVWRGARGILHSCRLECTCAWTSAWTSDPAALRILRAVHLDDPLADIGAGVPVTEASCVSPAIGVS
jgi:hypothetical protein